jgi:hypothetical protein
MRLLRGGRPDNNPDNSPDNNNAPQATDKRRETVK